MDAGRALPSIPPRTHNQSKRERLLLSRDVEALRVPDGTPVGLPKDAEVVVFQALGGSFSVEHQGQLYRIDGMQADALGKPRLELVFEDAEPGIVNPAHIDQVLRTIYDPEIPVNLLDLGLIYNRAVDGRTIRIDMTLTAPGCGMGEVLKGEVAQRLRQIPNVEAVDVRLVFDPPWDRGMLSEVARLELGMI